MTQISTIIPTAPVNSQVAPTSASPAAASPGAPPDGASAPEAIQYWGIEAGRCRQAGDMAGEEKALLAIFNIAKPYGMTNPTTIAAISDLSNFYFAFLPAEMRTFTFHQQLASVMKKMMDTKHVITYRLHNRLGELCKAQGRWEEGIAAFKECIMQIQYHNSKLFVEVDWDRELVINTLGLCVCQRSSVTHVEEAEYSAKQNYHLSEKLYKWTDDISLLVTLDLCQLVHYMGKESEAIRMLDFRMGIDKNHPVIRKYIFGIIDQLHACYISNNDFGRAEKTLQSALGPKGVWNKTPAETAFLDQRTRALAAAKLKIPVWYNREKNVRKAIKARKAKEEHVVAARENFEEKEAILGKGHPEVLKAEFCLQRIQKFVK
ncbi:hypothetical protein HDU97_007617 [Phlyctochytrium planicorne]|nr:hypothetical protein HDU97_007617 [Phlyctochytrium planicorne]